MHAFPLLQKCPHRSHASVEEALSRGEFEVKGSLVEENLQTFQHRAAWYLACYVRMAGRSWTLAGFVSVGEVSQETLSSQQFSAFWGQVLPGRQAVRARWRARLQVARLQRQRYGVGP